MASSYERSRLFVRTPIHMKPKLPTRPCKIPGWGLFQVPRHIVRVASINPETGWLKSAGWQVCYGQRPWRYFSDSKEKPKREAVKRNPRTSLARAYAHLLSIYEPPKPRVRQRERNDKRYPTGVVGIRYVELPPGRKNVSRYYVEVTPVKAGDRIKRFYVCTENTFSQEKLNRAWTKAIEHRRRLEREK